MPKVGYLVKLLENARSEGTEVVEVEEEANLILRAMTTWPTQGHYWIN